MGVIGGLVGGPATLAYLWKSGPLVAAAWVVALAGMVAWITLAMIFVYAAMLHVLRPDRFRRVLSYAQLLFSVTIFTAPLFLAEATEGMDLLRSIDTEGAPALLLLPPGWFASFLELAAGSWSGTSMLAAMAGAGSIAALLRYGGRRISLSYAERLGALASASEARRPPPARPGRAGRSWLSPDLRVIKTLVRGQFRHDMKFRMAVLGFAPLTVFYIFLGFRQGPLPDPFVELGFDAGGLWPINAVVLFFPLMLLTELYKSDSFRASWIFFSAPKDMAKLITLTGRFVTVFYLIPYVVVVAAVLAWAFADIWHGVGHAVFLGLAGHIGMHIFLLVVPRLPFSQPPRVAQRSGKMFVVLLGGILTAMVIVPAILRLAYMETTGAIATIALLALVSLFLPGAVERRLRLRVRELEFGA